MEAYLQRTEGSIGSYRVSQGVVFPYQTLIRGGIRQRFRQRQPVFQILVPPGDGIQIFEPR